jgi:hypothetical protein
LCRRRTAAPNRVNRWRLIRDVGPALARQLAKFREPVGKSLILPPRGDLGGRPEAGEKIVAALEKARVEFTNDDQPGVPDEKERKEIEMSKTLITIAERGV